MSSKIISKTAMNHHYSKDESMNMNNTSQKYCKTNANINYNNNNNKNINNNDNLNPQKYSQASITGTEHLSRQSMSKENLCANNHPRLRELLNDKIFQYFFTTSFNSKDYNEFKNFSLEEKLFFMIDLYFFIVIDLDKDVAFLSTKGNDSEEEAYNFNGEVMDRLMLIKNDLSKKHIIKLLSNFSINDYTTKYNDIMSNLGYMKKNNLKTLSFGQNKFNFPELNTNNQENGTNNNIYYDNNNTDFNDMRKKQTFSMGDLHTHEGDLITNNNINNSTYMNNVNKTQQPSTKNNNNRNITYSSMNYTNTNNMKDNTNNNRNNKAHNYSNNNTYLSNMNNSLTNLQKTGSYSQIKFDNKKLFKIGEILKCNLYSYDKKGKNEINFSVDKVEYISVKNDIKEKNVDNNNQDVNGNQKIVAPLNYKILRNSKRFVNVNFEPMLNIGTTFNPKNKHKSRSNVLIIQDSIMVEQNNPLSSGFLYNNKVKRNLLLIKNENKLSANDKENAHDKLNFDLIKKIYLANEDEVSFNKNEINKIGILLLEYIQLEEKLRKCDASGFITLLGGKNPDHEKLVRYKQNIEKFKGKLLKKIGETKQFLDQHK